MDNVDHFIVARALHIMGVVLWIGGVAFVTSVLIPSLKRNTESADRLDLFEKLEGRFSLQAKMSTLLTGLTGFYMLIFMDAWDRYLHVEYWWLHLMTLVWFIFTAVLFVFEPLFLHRWFHKKATQNSDAAFSALHVMHVVLLSLSLIAVVAAVAGSHGFRFSE